MTTYSADFNGETTGSFSTNWTNRYATTAVTVESVTDAEDDRVHQDDGTGSGIQLWSLDAVDGDANRDNCEVLMRAQTATDASNNMGMWMRASGSSGSEDGYLFHWNNLSLQVQRHNSGTPTNISASADADSANYPWYWYTSDRTPAFNRVPAGLWLWFRFRLNGTGATVTIQAKFWVDGQEEPDNWAIDTTDTSGSRITGVGWIGFGREAHASANTDFDYIGIGTNGDTAPQTVSTNTVIRITQAGAQALVSEGDPIVRITQAGAQALISEGDPVVRITGSYAQVLYQLTGGGGGGSSAEGSLVIAT